LIGGTIFFAFSYSHDFAAVSSSPLHHRHRLSCWMNFEMTNLKSGAFEPTLADLNLTDLVSQNCGSEMLMSLSLKSGVF